MTVLEIILVATHIFAIVAGYAAGKQDGIQVGRADMYKVNR